MKRKSLIEDDLEDSLPLQLNTINGNSASSTDVSSNEEDNSKPYVE